MKIHYVSGSRADFGLMRSTLQRLALLPDWDVRVVLVGQALDPSYGNVEAAVTDAGLMIAARVPARLTGTNAQEMAIAFANEVEGLALFWESDRPDFVLLLGDRGEMLAAAIVAFHLEIPTAHLHGGERSGTLDDGFRHAISKLVTWHFPATARSAERLGKMGEDPANIVTIGAPGLVDIEAMEVRQSGWLERRFPEARCRSTALLIFHPVVQEASLASAQMDAILTALAAENVFAIALRSNSDAGGREIDRRLTEWSQDRSVGVLLDHLDRDEFLQTLKAVDVLVGNSSSGIVESASLGTPCLNIGSRQDERERNSNVIDCPRIDVAKIRSGLVKALGLVGPFTNVYGDGNAHGRLAMALSTLAIDSRAPKKRNSY